MAFLRRIFHTAGFYLGLGLLFGGALPAQVSVQIGSNFAGSDNSQTYGTPADGNGAVGLDYYVEFINTTFAVYNKTNGAGVVKISDTQFWSNSGPGGSGVGGITFSPSDAVSDPRVIYDSASHRWFASQVKFNANASDPSLESNYYLLGVSDTDDPSGPWHVFSFLSVPGIVRFADFPTLGVDAEAVYIGGDIYHGETNPLGSALTMIPKADLLANPPFITNRIFFGISAYTNRGAVLQPVTCVDGSSRGNVLAVGNLGEDFELHSNLVATTVFNPGTPSATLAPATNILVDGYTAPFDAIQPDGTDTLADNDARLSAQVYCVHGVIYAVHSTQVDDRAAIRWYRIAASNYALLESGTIADADLDLIYPSIAANANGVVVIGCNGTSINTYISSFAFVGRTANGTTTFGNPILLAAGDIEYHDITELYGLADESRWGDYSAVSVDPADPNRFWTIQMLPLYDTIITESGSLWRMQITELITRLPSPLLTLSQTDSDLTISWPAAAANFKLQHTTNLTTGVGWLSFPQTPATNGNALFVNIPMSGPQEFFRLVQGL